jgi:hypothetical protein
MLRKFVFGFLITTSYLSALCQESETSEISVKGHYFGIQANQLIRQVFNFSNSSTPVNNPYLVIFSFNSSTGFGANFSLGYNHNETNTGDALTSRVITNSDFNTRVGLEKKSMIGKKFVVSVGGDILYQAISTESNSTDIFSGNITTISKTSGFGIGPRLGLFYHLTDRFLIGTEANYYLKFMTQKFEVKPGDSDEEDLKQFQLNVPTAIFLVLKF